MSHCVQSAANIFAATPPPRLSQRHNPAGLARTRHCCWLGCDDWSVLDPCYRRLSKQQSTPPPLPPRLQAFYAQERAVLASQHCQLCCDGWEVDCTVLQTDVAAAAAAKLSTVCMCPGPEQQMRLTESCNIRCMDSTVRQQQRRSHIRHAPTDSPGVGTAAPPLTASPLCCRLAPHPQTPPAGANRHTRTGETAGRHLPAAGAVTCQQQEHNGHLPGTHFAAQLLAVNRQHQEVALDGLIKVVCDTQQQIGLLGEVDEAVLRVGGSG